MEHLTLEALRKVYKGQIASAVANINVYLDNPAGIGDHSDIVSAIDTQIGKLCEAEDKIYALEKHFISAGTKLRKK